MNPEQQQMLIQALAGQTTGTPRLAGGMPQAIIENQLQMMRRLGSPLYANSPLRSGQSSVAPLANPFNAQAQAAFAPVQQQQRPQ
jgi:hypothetical protein